LEVMVHRALSLVQVCLLYLDLLLLVGASGGRTAVYLDAVRSVGVLEGERSGLDVAPRPGLGGLDRGLGLGRVAPAEVDVAARGGELDSARATRAGPVGDLAY